MACPPGEQLRYRVLHASPLVAVRDYVCTACRSGAGGEETTTTASVVLVRRGAFTRHFGRRSATSDTNHAALFARHATYRVSHPADDGDRCTSLVTTPRLLHDLVRELDPSVDEHPEQPFPGVDGPCDAATFLQHRELVQRLEAARPPEPMWADVTALQLIATVLTAAFARHGSARPQPTATAEDHRERVEAVKTFLAARLRERVTLDAVAAAAHASPFHLARMFQRHAGMPVHRYHLHLRLRAALERIAGTRDDLTSIALGLGFSSHSHFTDRFRAAFGCAPSRVRGASTRSVRRMRKNVEV